MNKNIVAISEAKAWLTLTWDCSLLLLQTLTSYLWNRALGTGMWEWTHQRGSGEWVRRLRTVVALLRDACCWFVHSVLSVRGVVWYVDISTVLTNKDFSPRGSIVLILASLVWSCSQPAHSRRYLLNLYQRRWRNGLEELGFSIR